MDQVIELLPKLFEETGVTLYLVAVSMVFGGIGGLILGLALYVTRQGGIYANKAVFTVLNVIVNFFRPIPFIIFIPAIQPLVRALLGTGIGNDAMIMAISIAATFGVSRIVEQNLVTVPHGVLEASRASGASRLRTIWSVVLPEALGPLILGYTFVFVAIVEMSALAGYLGGGGLGSFAIQWGFRQFEPIVTWAAVIVIVIVVQIVQFLGNTLARKVLRR
ncbi:ABC transporter permease subunit [Paramicrobacterium agarici]|uniref:D-methionine transport system permease protein n=1 Tax=Paramicrobacterium agarici TaxID=630514 RepID=A0A2A9DYQ2_9MICO|nr:ABC transporter permease subunit [Microbacterium agarici]PFG31818.1 D-methionine transport system permease protein [Microbacterium agarici]